MNKGQTHIFKGILYEYGNQIVIADWEIKVGGCIITQILWNEETDEIQYFTGDMEEDDYAEEVFPTEETINKIYEMVVENF